MHAITKSSLLLCTSSQLLNLVYNTLLSARSLSCAFDLQTPGQQLSLGHPVQNKILVKILLRRLVCPTVLRPRCGHGASKVHVAFSFFLLRLTNNSLQFVLCSLAGVFWYVSLYVYYVLINLEVTEATLNGKIV